MVFITQMGDYKAAFHKIAKAEFDFSKQALLNFTLLNKSTDYFLMSNIHGYQNNRILNNLETESAIAIDSTLRKWIDNRNSYASEYTLDDYRQMPLLMKPVKLDSYPLTTKQVGL